MNTITVAAVPGLTLRFAAESDVPTILTFIRELAEYERLAHEVVADESALRSTLFGARPYAEVILAEFVEERGKPAVPVGFALFFHNYSTFLGRPGIYLEDLFVSQRVRGKGVGRALLAYLAQLAVERGCGRLDWAVLDWNEDAIRFYEGIGARAIDEWRIFRLRDEALERLAGEHA